MGKYKQTVISSPRNYKKFKSILQKEIFQNITTGNIHGKMNVNQAINMLSLLWNQVKSETIKKQFPDTLLKSSFDKSDGSLETDGH